MKLIELVNLNKLIIRALLRSKYVSLFGLEDLTKNYYMVN